MKVQTQYSGIIADVRRDVVQHAWSKEKVDSLGRRVKEFGKVLLETFDAHYDSVL